MSGDYSNSNHEVFFQNTVSTQGEEVVLDGDDDRLRVGTGDHADWALGSDDWTMEIFGAKFASVTVSQALIAVFESTGDKRAILWRFRGDLSPKRLQVLASSDGTAAGNTTLTADWSPTADTAYDLCIERSGDTVRFYVDGAMIDSGTLTGSIFDSDEPLYIGDSVHDGGETWGGRFKAVRITKGVARYATNTSYTVPTLPLPTQ